MNNSTGCVSANETTLGLPCSNLTADMTTDLQVYSGSNTMKAAFVKDKICVDARLFRVCAKDIEFYAIVGD